MHEFVFNIGSAHFIAGRYGKAVEFARKSLGIKPGQPGTLRLLAAASAFLGKTDEAADALDRMMRAVPSMSEQHLRSFLPPEVARRYVEGLRLAGWQG